MRTLTSTLTAAQASARIRAKAKVVLTRAAQSTRTYEEDRIVGISYTQEPYSQIAKVALDNSDNALTDLDLRGFKGVISMGAVTDAGAEYSAQPPLWVIGQKMESSQGRLVCKLRTEGIFDLMARDRASAAFQPTTATTATVKDHLTAIAGATMTGFTHCTAYTVTYDSEDSLIDSHQPQDGFRVFTGDDRRAKFRELLERTGCHARVEDDGEIHIFVPIIAEGWTSPTGHSDPDTVWDNETNAYDNDNDTYADTDAIKDTWTSYLEFTIASMLCNVLRVKATGIGQPGNSTQMDLDVYYSGAWHGIYEGNIGNAPGAAAEFELGGTYAVTKMRVRFYAPSASANGIKVYEVDFGQAYEYEYTLARGDHAFYSKAYRESLVMPNKVTVQSNDDDSPSYSASATDATSNALLPIEEYRMMRLASTAEASSIATAIIGRAQVRSQMGTADVPINFGAEALDFIHVIDARSKDDRNGNIGHLHISYKAWTPNQTPEWSMTFSFGNWTTTEGVLERLGITATELQRYIPHLMVKSLYAELISALQINVSELFAISAELGTVIVTDGKPIRFFSTDDTYIGRISGNKTVGLALHSINGYDVDIIGDGAVDIDSNTGDITLDSAAILNLGAITRVITDDLDASATSEDIGQTTEFDGIYCDSLFYNGGSLPDELDDLALICQIRNSISDPSKLAMDSLPAILKHDRAKFMAKAMTKIDRSEEKLKARLQKRLQLVDQTILRENDPKKLKVLGHYREKIGQARGAIGVDRAEKVKAWEERFEYISQHFIPAGPAIALSLGAHKQANKRLRSIEDRLKALEQ